MREQEHSLSEIIWSLSKTISNRRIKGERSDLCCQGHSVHCGEVCVCGGGGVGQKKTPKHSYLDKLSQMSPTRNQRGGQCGDWDEGTWFACCQMMALWMNSIRPPFSVRCTALPTPLTQTPLGTPWEEVCCAVAALNQHRPNEVSHLTPSSLRPSHGCQSHNERPSISSAWLTHFDSWESLGPVRSKLPLSKRHHWRIHQPPSLSVPPVFFGGGSFGKNRQKWHFPCLCFPSLSQLPSVRTEAGFLSSAH